MCIETMEALAVGREVPLENLETLAELSDPTSSSGQFFTRLRQLLLDMSNNPASALLVLPSEDKRKRRKEEKDGDMETLDEYFRAARANSTSKVERGRGRGRDVRDDDYFFVNSSRPQPFFFKKFSKPELGRHFTS